MPPAGPARVRGLARRRWACGFTVVSNGNTKPCRWDLDANAVVELETDGRGGAAFAVNSSGAVAGVVGQSGYLGGRPVLWPDPATTIELPIPADTTACIPLAIDDAGNVLARYRGPAEGRRAVLWRAGGGPPEMIPLPPGGVGAFAGGLGAGGLACGWAETPAENQYAWLWGGSGPAILLVPPGVPEPDQNFVRVYARWTAIDDAGNVAVTLDVSGGPGTGTWIRSASGTWTNLGRWLPEPSMNGRGDIVAGDGQVRIDGAWSTLHELLDRPTTPPIHTVAISDELRIAVNFGGSPAVAAILVPAGHTVERLQARPYLLHAQLLGGIAVDGGGIRIVNGKPEPVPPWDPLSGSTLSRLSLAQRQSLVAMAIAETAEMLPDDEARATVRRAAAAALASAAARIAKAGLSDSQPRRAMEKSVVRAEEAALPAPRKPVTARHRK
ncbi:MAG TPA: hypothetical protein VEA99_18620 [Gemmatimonadaceae bacterium]|nr:hypothetical protein [Gemmatimonadaceae bacterium]